MVVQWHYGGHDRQAPLRHDDRPRAGHVLSTASTSLHRASRRHYFVFRMTVSSRCCPRFPLPIMPMPVQSWREHKEVRQTRWNERVAHCDVCIQVCHKITSTLLNRYFGLRLK
jgi:hypothetical protein